MTTVAIIDGDVLAYMSCFSRWAPDTIDDFEVVVLDDAGRKVTPIGTADADEEYEEKCWINFENGLARVLDQTFADDYLMAVSGNGNYRDKIYSGYKANRRARPPTDAQRTVPLLRLRAGAAGYALHSDGREADDFIRIWAFEARRAGHDAVICSVDKDLRCIVGRHYDLKKGVAFEVDLETARRNYYTQFLTGDAVDCIPGIPRCGPVKAGKILASCSTDTQYQEAIVDTYRECFGKDWHSWFLSNAKLLHIQRSIDDYSLKWPCLSVVH